MSIKKKVNKLVGLAVNAVTSGVSQTSPKRDKTVYPEIEGMKKLCRQTAADSFVLLKNDPVPTEDGGKNPVLPLTKENLTAFFGRVQFDTFFVGYGSGGDVNPHYTVSIHEGLKANRTIRREEALEKTYLTWRKKNKVDNGYWGHWPMCYEEMHVSEATVIKAREKADTAVIFLGRAAGEDRENTLTKGSYYLTDEEENMVALVSSHFARTAVVLNIGNLIDLSWTEKYRIPCLGICWQGGMETGNAVADILSGKTCPAGRLPDTVARRYEDYPSAGNFGGKKQNVYEEDVFVGYRYFDTFAAGAVLFPFAHGLSYTTFEVKPAKTVSAEPGKDLCFSLEVKNTGGVSGRHTVPVFVLTGVQPAVAVPARRLVGFAKTPVLAPGEVCSLDFCITPEKFAVYDDTGNAGTKNAWVIPAGEYAVVADGGKRALPLCTLRYETTAVIEKTASRAAPAAAFMRLSALKGTVNNGAAVRLWARTPERQGDLKAQIEENLPPTLDAADDRTTVLQDAANGTLTLEEFAATLTDEELEAISRGDYVMNSPLGPTGNAGVFGGTLESLRMRGVLPVTTTDGPSGIRLAARSSLLPCGTALAASWDPESVRALYEKLGTEMKDRGSDVLLAPGMNIHRDPLCGRNFEYFSEDPLLTGKMAGAVITGLRDGGAEGCVKHFACNNQETRRTKNNSILSERALREIYLRGFEYCVKEAAPAVLMTSYNKINGVWGHYHYELVTGILRGEWGYKGLVITDWWMQKSASPEFPALRDQAYRVRAGVDVLMPGGGRSGKRVPDGTLLESLGKPDGITRGELQQTAVHVLRFILQCEKFKKTLPESDAAVPAASTAEETPSDAAKEE
ncbi:MAG: glycoside hydrolase family 3 C-terminal domain-containing protein [Clostridia bacterium]|nr:glycoside hydrolase family 3 C-terminal domain-containing protein [Clostridia bacterium]